MMGKSKYEYMATVMKALGHPSRLFIVDELRDAERCVCELQEKIKSDMSTVSRHLAVLRNAGIVASRKENNMVFYRLAYPCVLSIFDCVLELKYGQQSDQEGANEDE